MNLTISKRKYTTAKALIELTSLVDKINASDLPKDIEQCESPHFYARIHIIKGCVCDDERYCEWDNLQAFWCIEEGCLTLLSVDAQDGGYSCYNICCYQQINFRTCMIALEGIIKEYNEANSRKDNHIEEFLKTCRTFVQEER